MPGTLVTVEPERVVADGVYVTLRDGVKAFLRKTHLPPRLRYDASRFYKALRVCVLCCQQNMPLLVLSAHPDVVALTRAERRLLPEVFII